VLLWTVYCVRRALCSFHLFRNNVSSRSPLPSYRIMPKTLQHKSISVAKPGGWKKTVAGRKLWMHPRPQPRTAPVSCVSYSSVEVWCIMNSPSASPLAPVAGALNWYCPRCNVDHPRHLRTLSAMSAIQGSSVRGLLSRQCPKYDSFLLSTSSSSLLVISALYNNTKSLSSWLSKTLVILF